jgi:hypothetical protein
MKMIAHVNYLLSILKYVMCHHFTENPIIQDDMKFEFEIKKNFYHLKKWKKLKMYLVC